MPNLRWSAAVALATFLLVAPLAAQSPVDTDGDGVADSIDCAPTDPRISTPHTYFWDLDGDQSGDSANPLTLCSLQPFRGSAAVGGDPADNNDHLTAALLPKGDRAIGLSFADAASHGAWRPDLARELGAETASFQLQWNLIETAPGAFTGPQAQLLAALPATYGAEGFSLDLAINPIAGATLTLPADLATGLAAHTIRFSDAAFIARYRAMLDHLKASLGNTPVTTLHIGREVDLYFAVRSDVAFWSDYYAFFEAVRAHARTLWGASLRVGISSTWAGLLQEPTGSLMQALNGNADMVSVAYALGVSGMVPDPVQVRPDIEHVIARYFPKPLVVAVSFPSAPAVGSSETRQAQFVGELFQVWDSYAALMPLVSFSQLHDPLGGGAAQRSSGLRTVDGPDRPKSAYHALRTATLNRGWWQVRPLASRPFLLGFTTAPYDHIPGASLDDDVMANIRQAIGDHGDLIAYHFDNGVPWVEALADTFATTEPPYSNNVREVWTKHRAARPPGAKVVVALNPIGVPRNVLAPYWGVGEGFYHDQDFDRVGTGVIEDYENRLLPAPWNTYALDSPQVKGAFFNYLRRAIDFFDADYVVTGIEVNLSLLSDPDFFERYAELQRHVYTQLRADQKYDHVKIVVSFVAEPLVTDELGTPILIEALEQEGVAPRHLQAIQDLEPYTDLIGLSVYPIKGRFGSYQIQAGYFESLFERIKSGTTKPLAITEAGYPSSNFAVLGQHFDASDEEQQQFVRLLLHESAKFGVQFVTNYSVRDQTPYLDKLRVRSTETPPYISPGLLEFYKYFEFTGLFHANGNAKLAAELFASTLLVPISGGGSLVPPLTFAGGNGELAVILETDPQGRLSYSASRNGAVVLEPSPLGVTVDGVDLGTGVIDVELVSSNTIDETYPVRGAHSLARTRADEVVLEVQRTGVGDRTFRMVWRFGDEGFAFRYVIPGEGPRTISGESSGWKVPEGSPVWHQLSTSNYEGLYLNLPIGYFNTNIGGPLTIELSSGAGYLTLTEGALRDYSGLTYDGDLGSRVLKAQFLDDTSWQVGGGSATPWRLSIVSSTLNAIVNSDMTTDVSLAPDPTLFPQGARTAWIRPGKALWSWWSDQLSGADWNVQRQYVDYAAQLRADYITVDAFWEEGFPIAGRDQFDRLAELVTYGRSGSRSVGVWVWKSWFSLIDASARHEFFEKVRSAGAIGVKIDNIDDPRTESIANVRLCEAILRDAAAAKLMVNFHGLHKPTGLQRTYPNLIGQESIAGMEYTALTWQLGQGLPVAHSATVPFVRYAAGPADYTPLTFDVRKIGQTTFAGQLASAGVLSAPLLHYADDPAILLGQPVVADLLRTLPTEWDETIVLPQSRIGALVVMARRAGTRWYLFAMNGDAAAGVTLTDVPLTFLGSGRYQATLIADGTHTTFDRQERPSLSGGDSIDVSMLPGGGFTARFVPAPDLTTTVEQGFSSIPPAATWPAWITAYEWIRDHGDVVSHSLLEGVPWIQALTSADPVSYPAHLQQRWQQMRGADETVVPTHKQLLRFSPLDSSSYASLAPYIGSADYLPLPAPWSTYSFNSPHVKTAMLNYLTAAVQFFTPEYVAIGARANILLAHAPLQWGAFKELNEFLYTNLKQRFPALKVFTSVDYEHLLGLAPASHAIENAVRSFYPDVLQAEVRDLLRHSDYVAVASLPYAIAQNRYAGQDGRLDFDYYDRAAAIARDIGKQLVFEEIGYTSQDVVLPDSGTNLHGSDQLQADYQALVLGVAHTENARLVVNAIVGDYGTSYGNSSAVMTGAYTGLFRTDGASKPALAIWDSYRAQFFASSLAVPNGAPETGRTESLTETGPSSPAGSSTQVQAVARGDRILSIDVSPTQQLDDPVETARAVLGVQGVQLMFNWTDIETSPGVYNVSLLQAIDAYYSAKDMIVSLTIRPVDAIHKHVPSDLAGLAFDHPMMVFRFARVLDRVFANLPNAKLASVGIGNEVDEYFRLHPETLPAYKVFYDYSLFHAKAIRPDVKIGVSANLHALTTGGNASFLQALNEYSDIVLVLYYPLNFDFTVRGTSVVAGDVEALVTRYWYKKIHFREAGYPSSAETNGSEEQQRVFVEQMFEAWDAHAAQIELISFFRLTDFAPEQVDYYANYYLQAASVPFRSFLASLGLREWTGFGQWKSAFFQFYLEAKARGW